MVKGTDMDKGAFVLFINALIHILQDTEGIVVERDGIKFVVYREDCSIGPTMKIISEEELSNPLTDPVGSLVWTHFQEE